MKGLILSGGKGTRLRPLTHTSAKQLIPIANKPILFYALENLVEAGIKDIGIIVGDTKKEIMEAVGNGKAFNCKITYIEQESPLGLAHAVLTAEDFIKEEPFTMFLGDNFIKGGITDFVKEFYREKPNALILLTEVPNPWDFGVAELKNKTVVKLVEKPKNPKSNLALVGVYIFDSHIFKASKKIKPSFRGELEITDAIQGLIDQGLKVNPHLIKGWWKDTGKLEDILEANRIVLETIENKIHGNIDNLSQITGKAIIEKGVKIKNSVIRGPVIIGENSRIINSYIGPFTSIYYDCLIVISNSPLKEGFIFLEALKLMIGDHGKVGII
ncbi:MAG: glucose-1-phosphate thymidylyltransferase [Armatimonadetes bacterium]|nr:glucose-1-phosphate thymidylyltransferase [Armatimonadota bacterium]